MHEEDDYCHLIRTQRLSSVMRYAAARAALHDHGDTRQTERPPADDRAPTARVGVGRIVREFLFGAEVTT